MANDGNNKQQDRNDAPLPLVDLRERVTTRTYTWLSAADDKEAEERKSQEAETVVIDIFQNEAGVGNEEEDEWASISRVQEWTSSSSNPDGFGGYDKVMAKIAEESDEENEVLEPGAVKVYFILSEVSGGHGEELWAASRHVANLLVDFDKCCKLLAPLLAHQEEGEEDIINRTSGEHSQQATQKPGKARHPLAGVKFLELGAGAGLPSWAAMWRGARVVCTDMSIENRIRCLAECAERNGRAILETTLDDEDNNPAKIHAVNARACPYDWGSPVDEVSHALDGTDTCFDVVLAADCCYMPDYHSQLLDSIKMLMSKKGLALLPFALHGNTDDNHVWAIVEKARGKGFQVEILETQQLTPQCSNMDPKRGLVNMIRMTFI